jgi:hypothetical protein
LWAIGGGLVGGRPLQRGELCVDRGYIYRHDLVEQFQLGRIHLRRACHELDVA